MCVHICLIFHIALLLLSIAYWLSPWVSAMRVFMCLVQSHGSQHLRVRAHRAVTYVWIYIYIYIYTNKHVHVCNYTYTCYVHIQ